MNFIELFQQYFPSFSTALGLTLQLALASLICASIIGIIFGMFSVSKNKILNIICKIYVDIIRGTPLVVQVFIMYYGQGSDGGSKESGTALREGYVKSNPSSGYQDHASIHH